MVQKCSRVKGFEFRVSSFEFRVSSFEFRVSSFEFRVSSFEFGNLVSGVEGEGFHLGSLPSISFFIKTVHCAAYICALDQLGFRPPESRETWVSGWVDEGLGSGIMFRCGGGGPGLRVWESESCFENARIFSLVLGFGFWIFNHMHLLAGLGFRV